MVASYPFQVKFLTPAIKICAGCRKGYLRSEDGRAPPPLDICLVHKEQHLYYNVVNAKQQLSSLSIIMQIPRAQGCVFLTSTLVLFLFLKKSKTDFSHFIRASCSRHLELLCNICVVMQYLFSVFFVAQTWYSGYNLVLHDFLT